VNRDESIKLRVTAAELAAWQAAADKSDMVLSEWIRQRCAGPRALPPANVKTMPIPFDYFAPELQTAIVAGARYPTNEEVKAAMRRLEESKRAGSKR
jgi:hypothetical protein